MEETRYANALWATAFVWEAAIRQEADRLAVEVRTTVRRKRRRAVGSGRRHATSAKHRRRPRRQRRYLGRLTGTQAIHKYRWIEIKRFGQFQDVT